MIFQLLLAVVTPLHRFGQRERRKSARAYRKMRMRSAARNAAPSGPRPRYEQNVEQQRKQPLRRHPHQFHFLSRRVALPRFAASKNGSSLSDVIRSIHPESSLTQESSAMWNQSLIGSRLQASWMSGTGKLIALSTVANIMNWNGSGNQGHAWGQKE